MGEGHVLQNKEDGMAGNYVDFKIMVLQAPKQRRYKKRYLFLMSKCYITHKVKQYGI